MKALILNAFDCDHAGIETYDDLIDELKNYAIVIDSIDLSKTDIAVCQHCYYCWLHSPGLCTIDDHGRTVASAMMQNDAVIVLTESREGNVSPLVTRAIERTIPTLKYPGKRPSLIAIGLADQEDIRSVDKFIEATKRMGVNLHFASYSADLVYKDESRQGRRAKIQAAIADGIPKI